MLALIAFYWMWLILAFLIGLGTAWWVWWRPPVRRPLRADPDEPIDWQGDDALFTEKPASQDETVIASEAETPASGPADESQPAPDATAAPQAAASPQAPAIEEAVSAAASPAEGQEEAAIVEATPAAAAAEAVPVPASSSPAAPLAPQGGGPDDLTRIKGVGPQLNILLHGLGITRFDQIARWTPDDIAQIDEHLGVFRGRAIRDEWVEQARLLLAGDMEGFRARFGQH